MDAEPARRLEPPGLERRGATGYTLATTGAADVAFLPYSLTFEKELAAGKVVPVPEALYPRIEQSGIVLSASKSADLARKFLAFVSGEKGRAILAKYGYGLP